MCGADRRPNNNPGPAAVPLGVFAKDAFECSTSAKHFRDPDLDSLSLPSPARPNLPPPAPAASSCVPLQLCLALQGGCSSPAVHSHQRVCFCAGVRPGRTRVRAPPHAPLPPLPYLGELFQPQPRGGKVGLAKISPRLVGAAQTLREFNSFLPRLAFLLRAVGRKRRNGPFLLRLFCVDVHVIVLLFGLSDAYVVLQVSV